MRPPPSGIVPPMSWAFQRDVFDFRYDPDEARRLLDAAGFPDPDGDGPRPRLTLTLKTSTSEVYRIQAAAIQQDLARVGIALDDPLAGIRHAAGRRRQGQLPDVHGAVRRRDRPRHAAPRLPLDAGAAGRRVQPRALSQRRRRSADRTGVRRRDRRRARGALYGAGAARDRAAMCPTFRLWYKTNVAVFQPDIQGVRLSPIADFTFLKDVYRSKAQ